MLLLLLWLVFGAIRTGVAVDVVGRWVVMYLNEDRIRVAPRWP